MPDKKNYSKKETRSLIRQIKRGGKEGQLAMETIYKDFKYMVYLKQLANEFRLHESEVNDFFHDAILIFRRKVRSNDIDTSMNIHAYLTNIVKNLIQNKSRSRQIVEISPDLSTPNVIEESVSEYYNRKEIKDQLTQILAVLNVKCRRLLVMWKEGYNYDEIAQQLSLKNRDTARKNKFTCMKKLMGQVHAFPQLKGLLS